MLLVIDNEINDVMGRARRQDKNGHCHKQRNDLHLADVCSGFGGLNWCARGLELKVSIITVIISIYRRFGSGRPFPSEARRSSGFVDTMVPHPNSSGLSVALIDAFQHDPSS